VTTAATPPAPEATVEETDSFDLTSDEAIDDGDELLLDNDDILTSPVGSAPIAPPADDEIVEASHGEEEDKPKIARESGTLFERMSNIARGAAKAQVDDEEPTPGFRREPIDIPRFLNRQNNQ
jgi:cell division protein FtsZ